VIGAVVTSAIIAASRDALPVPDDWGSAFAAAPSDAMAVYDDVLVPRLFAPWADLLLDLLTVRPGECLLDVACGPGSIPSLAARLGPGGAVTGCDLSPAMLDLAAAKGGPAGGASIEYVPIRSTAAANIAIATR
jgi:SAM-dependent methyltransferase